MKKDLTRGAVTGTMLRFAGPMILGNLLQQGYNLADTLIVGRFLGADALAAVGSAYSLMTFLTSILIGLSMGSGSVFSLYLGRRDYTRLNSSVHTAFRFIGGVTVGMNLLVLLFLDEILRLLQIPQELLPMMRQYVSVVFLGIFFVFLYNYFSFLLRALGNSLAPLYFLGGAAVLNVALDLLFVVTLRRGIRGAGEATVLSQIFSGAGLGLYTFFREPQLRPRTAAPGSLREIVRFSTAACIQQSVMNFGILMIQGLVNSFGPQVMAAFAAAVKIDALAYMPAQEFGNAFSLFTSQNHGAGKTERVRQGVRSAASCSVVFCLFASALVWLTAPWLMEIFIDPAETAILATGTGYLRIEGSFYWGIGILFLLYGYFRGIGKPEMSIVLTVLSLGTRVVLAYALSPIPALGVNAIWWSIPIGWILADLVGIGSLRSHCSFTKRREGF